MTTPLRALILGSGYAGEGHTLALRRAGVDVIAMAGRTESAVQAAAARLEIPNAGTDWRQMIDELKPEIVAVGTPGGAHVRRGRAEARRGIGLPGFYPAVAPPRLGGGRASLGPDARSRNATQTGGASPLSSRPRNEPLGPTLSSGPGVLPNNHRLAALLPFRPAPTALRPLGRLANATQVDHLIGHK